MAVWPFNRNEVTMEMIERDPTCDPYYDPPGWTPPKWRKTMSFFWESIAKPPGERRYVNKLDRGLLFYLMLSYFIKALDQKNINNAYVSGMKQALHLNGNQYNYFTTMFNCGYLAGSIPSQISLSFARPSIMIPSCELFWSVLVFVQCRASSDKYLYACRFLQGFAESICFPTMMMIIGSWYKPEEIAKRVVIWDMTSTIASMFSGYLQAAIYTNLNGVGGFAGWQWLFIVDGVISLPIALLGYFAIPDFPTTTRALWLTDRDKEYSIRRMTEVGKKGPKKMTIKRFWKILSGWRFWAFITPYAAYITGAGTYMNLWLQAEHYSVQMINILPTIGNAIALVSAYLFAILSDITRWRWQLAIVTLLPYVFGNLVLGIWNVPFGWKFAANLVPSIGQPFFSLFMAWISDIFQDDTELRGYLPAIGNAIWYAQYAWFPVVAFPAQKAPHYPWGYWAALGLTILNIVGIYTCYLANMWDVKRRGQVVNKYGLYVDREELVDYEQSSLSDVKGGYIGEVVQEVGVDIERDSDLTVMKEK
ncbi:major facilitator superfamily domain-containing protein [Lipomyces doorenjongii]